jgi:hypothetical protein
MKNVLTISEEEKNRIRGLHLTESKDKRITSVLSEEGIQDMLNDDLTLCFIVNFESGRANKIELPRTGNIVNDIKFYGKVMRKLMQGMSGDRPFIDIEVGTSGTGSHERNMEVMDERVEQAIEFLLDKISKFYGPDKLKYSTPAVMDKVTVDTNYSTIEPGSILPNGTEVPTDPNHDYFKDAQYVQICLNPVTETPGYGSLADQFMKVTMEKTGTDEKAVYHILDQLRDEGDFIEFSKELKRDYGMDFYEIACDKMSVDLNPLWPGETEGPPELGGDDTTINAHLRRLGVEPVSC